MRTRVLAFTLRSVPRGLALVLLTSVAGASANELKTPADRQMAKATALFSAGDDAGSAKVCLRVIAESPDSNAASLAHIYLGLIALNAIDRRKALVEFEASIRIDPLTELPVMASPKAQILFDQARDYILRHRGAAADAPNTAPVPLQQSASPPLQPTAQAPTLATPPVEPIALLPERARAPAPSLAPSITCLAVAAAALGVGIGFGVASQQALSAHNATVYAAVATTEGNAAANNGRVADVAFIGAGAVGIAGIVLLALELTSGHAAPASASGEGASGFPLRAQF